MAQSGDNYGSTTWVWVADGRVIPVIILSTVEIQFMKIGRIGDVVMEVEIVGAEIHYSRSHRRIDQTESMSFSIITYL